MTAHQGGAMSEGSRGIVLPQVKRLTISHFSLYRNRSQNVVAFDKDVFCLSGANGLGKSTFLAILNYSLTGAVAHPDPKVQSLAEYKKRAVNNTPDYFSGRISAADRDIADVTIEFSIGSHDYKLTRGFFQLGELKYLRIQGPEVQVERSVDVDEGAEGEELLEIFEANAVQHCGLAKFDQLVYIQHFLVTFDERRHLLFWDPEVTRFSLFLAFGLDTARADAAGEWQRKADRLESQARNAQYQATSARSQIRDLLQRSGSPIEYNEDLEEKQRRLTEVRDRCAEVVDRRVAQEKDARLAVGIAAADHHALTIQYNRVFNDRLNPESGMSDHPLLLRLLHEQECGVCGTSGVTDIKVVTDLLASQQCPLCRSHVAEQEGDEDFDTLRELDQQLQESSTHLKSAQEDLERATGRLTEAQEELRESTRVLSEFEEDNSEWIRNKTANSGLSDVIKQLEAEQRSAEERRDKFREKRDEYQALVAPIAQELAEAYAEAETEFLPRFQSLARAFLGMDLHCRLEQRARGPLLIVTVNGQTRREQDALSESQRYFIDIALRMALTEHMLGGRSPACLLIDTPEGSLDIAYESRAGEMFGAFVRRDNRLIMTANLNSNRLVLELARVCGRETMHVERMTNWSILSEVQAQAEELFDQSYAAIQASLDGRMF
ncbi:AAA family ATPase [Streptomyces adustus]|uniref:Nuclease SbcCD subunit C n=1 Tax=Streptomyces adustus TaxID=1609272 RepID=A0A5N8VD13_9ACTN|nr:AAA family ATPase [Streptomyces adustus]MPY33147.1 AAA family ATPase [Streptomyces adustus]